MIVLDFGCGRLWLEVLSVCVDFKFNDFFVCVLMVFDWEWWNLVKGWNLVCLFNEVLIFDFFEFVLKFCFYDEVMDVWRILCLRFFIWEDVFDVGFVEWIKSNSGDNCV